MMVFATLFPLLAVFIPFNAIPVAADSYDMVKEYAGQTFFDEWTFYDHCAYDCYLVFWYHSADVNGL